MRRAFVMEVLGALRLRNGVLKEKDGYRLKSLILTIGHSPCFVLSCAFFSANSHCWRVVASGKMVCAILNFPCVAQWKAVGSPVRSSSFPWGIQIGRSIGANAPQLPGVGGTSRR